MAITKRAQARREQREAAIAAQRAMADGGRNRWAAVDESAALAARRKAAAAVNGPAGLARRLAKRWLTASEEERREVLTTFVEAGITPPWQTRP